MGSPDLNDHLDRLEDAAPTVRPSDASVSVRLTYSSLKEAQKVFAESLRRGALFVTGEFEWQPGQHVQLHVDLPFCGRSLEIAGIVAAVRPTALAHDDEEAGIALQLRTPLAALRSELEEATGAWFGTPDEPPAHGDRRATPRGPAHGLATLVVRGSRFPAEMLNLSYGGMLVLLEGLDLGLGGSGTAVLQHPHTGEAVSVECRIISQAPCDHGRMAAGIQFHYPARRIDEVMAFIDDLQGLQHAKELAQVRGSLGDAPLEDVIQTLAGASSEGTLRVSCGDEEGILIHRDGQIVHAATGLVSGMKAVSRLLLWSEGRFAYQASIDPFEATTEPLPIEAALLSATVNRDEAVRHGIAAFHPDDIFDVNTDLLDQVDSKLEDVHREIADHVRMGFPLGAILDILVQGDGVIYKALVELLESGVVARSN